MVEILGPPQLQPRICKSVARARAILGQCELRQTRPILIRVVNEMADEHEACGARFDCETDVLTLLPPERLFDKPATQELYGALSPEVFFDSLIVHELAHAFLNHSRGENITAVAHEYLAYALQFASLPEQVRSDFLAEIGEPRPDELVMVNSLVLMIAPTHFGASAYRHFAQQDSPCNFVDRFVEGDPELPFEFRMPPRGLDGGP